MTSELRALHAVFRSPDLRRLLLASLTTSVAVWGSALALAVYAYEKGGATAVGLMALARTLPGAPAAPLLTREADRRSRRSVLIAINLLRAVVLAATAAAVAAGAPLVGVGALVTILPIVGSAYKPSQAALLPGLARTPSELSCANVAGSMLLNLGFLIGSASAGALLALTSTASVLAGLAGVFLASLIPLSRCRNDRRALDDLGARPGRETLDGFRTVARDPQLLTLVSAIGTVSLVEGAVDVLAIASALGFLGMGAAGAGSLWAAWGVGAIAGGIATLRLLSRRRLTVGLTAGLVILGGAVALIGLAPAAGVAMVLLAGAGGGYTLVEAAAHTLLQRLSADPVLARVFGVVETLYVVGVAVGSTVAGLLVDAVGARPAWLLVGALMPVVALGCQARFAGLGVGLSAPDREYGLVRSSPIFAPLPVAIKERLARGLVEVRPDDLAEVIVEGDHGDRFYLVAEGELDVFERGVHRRTMGPGDGFGEIALLRDSPRTATVRAKSSVVLLALDRGPFLEAVTGQPYSRRAAEAVAEERSPRPPP